MHFIPLSCTSSLCNILFLNLGIYGFVQATVGVGTVLIWDFCIAYRKGGGGATKVACRVTCQANTASHKALFGVRVICFGIPIGPVR